MTTKTESKTNVTRLYAGISFRPEVLQYLNVLAKQTHMNRSWVLNTIVLEHAKLNHGAQLPSPLSKETVIHL